MRTIYISDVTGEQYDSVEALKAAEEKVVESKKEKDEMKRRVDDAWDKVSEIDDIYEKTVEAAEKLTEEYEGKFGEYIFKEDTPDNIEGLLTYMGKVISEDDLLELLTHLGFVERK